MSRAGDNRRREVAQYVYYDEHNQPLFRVVRTEPKGFYQQRSDSTGGWTKGLGSSRRVLYRLPQLLAADADETIHIVEGEKDADRLAELGLIATTNSGGAGNWRDEYSEALRGRTVAIIPDNDEPGRTHGVQVAESLSLVGCVVKLVELPDQEPKADVSDYLGKAGSVDELVKLVNSSAVYTQKFSTSESQDYSADQGHPYEETSTGIVCSKSTNDGRTKMALTNFTARIVADIVHDDGVESVRSFEIEAQLGGRKTTFAVPATHFAGLAWITPNLGAKAVVYAGTAKKDHARTAIQLLSPEPQLRIEYAHTGWREIDDRWVYLHAGGAIHADGLDTSIFVSLNGALSGIDLPEPPKDNDLIEAVQASLRILDLGPDEIVIPVLAAVFRAVLGHCDLSIHLVGPTGVFKSELAALAQQHFGAGLDARNLPGSWSSTDNALEMAAFTAKDALFCIDDFAPEGGQNDINRLHQKAARLLRAQGNHSARQRLTRDSQLRSAKPPRGLILSTGEDVPRGQSVRARALIVELGNGDLDVHVLTACQRDAATGVYAAAMSGFISWIAASYGDTSGEIDAEVAALRADLTLNGQHRRTPQLIANLALGLRYFLDFAADIGAMSDENAAVLWERGLTALRDAAQSQEAHQTASDPVAVYLELLRSALTAGDAHVTSADGGAPDNPQAWGWRGQSSDLYPQGKRIGWLEGDNLYLDPVASFRAAQDIGSRSSNNLAIGEKTLRKRLHEAQALCTTELDVRRTYTVRHTLNGSRHNVLHLKSSALHPTEPDQPDQADHEAPKPKENGHCQGIDWSGSTTTHTETRPPNLTASDDNGLPF